MIISSSLSPNAETDDIIVAFRQLFSFNTHDNLYEVEKWFQQRYPNYSVQTFNSGRSALYILLQSFDISTGDEVIVQAFTCVAVPNAVLWVGATPIYVDIDNTYNLDVVDLEKKVTGKTKAIIVQHTFGIPANIEAIVIFAKKHKLLVIEDCAHCLGSLYKGKPLGSFGDAAFFSFGRDKVVSSVWGGAAILSAKWKVQSGKLKQLHDHLSYPSKFWTFQQLLHPVAFSLILPLYHSGIGKALLVALQKLTLLSFPVYPEEKIGERPKDFPNKYPNALAALLICQLKKLDHYRKVRHDATLRYCRVFKSKGLGYDLLRFPLLVDCPRDAIERAKKNGILLGNWYHHVIDPMDVRLSKVGYTSGSCPRAEYAASHIINLPTRISSEQIDMVIGSLHHEKTA